jgi:hypothetical protein
VATRMALKEENERPRQLDWLHRYVWQEIDEPQRARLASMSYSTCRDCPGLDRCSEGLELLDQPVTVRGGIRIQ